VPQDYSKSLISLDAILLFPLKFSVKKVQMAGKTTSEVMQEDTK